MAVRIVRLGTARLPYTGDVVFRRDVVATGLRRDHNKKICAAD